MGGSVVVEIDNNGAVLYTSLLTQLIRILAWPDIHRASHIIYVSLVPCLSWWPLSDIMNTCLGVLYSKYFTCNVVYLLEDAPRFSFSSGRRANGSSTPAPARTYFIKYSECP